ncbi:unnamed protein product [Allacma fusca]|uniref:Peptidase M14 domain-containing protein n=1 Tax=Allacma fusca TaxID=39272 RepID=A0A8J2KGK1_9HEXA|nr:unnamed protein product [Allacma fusca]
MKFIVVLACCIAAISAATVRYDGQEVLRTFPSSREQVDKLATLQETHDFWSAPRLNGPTDIRAGGVEKLELRKFLIQNEIKYEVLIDDVQQRIYWEAKSYSASANNSVNALTWTNYHTLAEIHTFLQDISNQHKDISEVINIGTSTEGRTLKLIRIGANGGTRKKAIFMDGAIHAREWIAPAVATWFVNELLTNRNKYTTLLSQVDFYILPVANVDGYEYSRTTDRMWRKTRSANSGSTCRGTDPNRNFATGYGGPGTSTNPCSEIYRGTRAFSEPETKAMSDFINNRSTANWIVYAALHSYSQMILTPWGYTYDFPPTYTELKNLGVRAANALTAVHRTSYEVGSITEILSPGSGGSDDWAYGSGNFRYSYTIELRDTGRYGFLLPASQIIPTAQETWEAVLVMANAM